MLGNIAAKGYGMAMFSGDVVESFNRLLKIAYNDHSNRGGSWRDGFHGALDAKGDVLRQVAEWFFQTFMPPLRLGEGCVRTHPRRRLRARARCVQLAPRKHIALPTGPPPATRPPLFPAPVPH